MPATPTDTDSSTAANSTRATKRPRAETQSQAAIAATGRSGRAAPVASSPSSPPAKQVAKKQKKGASSSAQPHEDVPDANLVPDVVEGDADATDGGIDSARARVRRAGKSRLLTAQEKRDRFQAKYQGKTPEQILGALSRLI